jgi:ubiquinone/menaquinone biosynthesis C-methylase UbiE
MYREAGCILDDHSLEALPCSSNYFDLAVMINVLDHVQNAHKCMENLVNIVRPGGLLIVGQDLSNQEDMEVLRKDAGAVGHPIKLDDEWFEPFLKGFEPVVKKILSRKQGRVPSHHYGTLIFAGRKK